MVELTPMAQTDAIVVGSGISGGWAAKELTEKGLKTLVLERGPMVRHIEDYPTMNMDPWEFEHGNVITKETKKRKQNQKRSDRHFSFSKEQVSWLSNKFRCTL